MKNNHLTISIDAEKTFDKIQYSFKMNTHSKLVIEESFFNLVEIISEKFTTHILFNGEYWTLSSYNREQGMMFLSLLFFNIIPEVLTSIIGPSKNEIKVLNIVKKEVKLSDYMIIYIRINEPQLEIISEFRKIHKNTVSANKQVQQKLNDARSIHKSHLYFYN